MQLGWTKAKKEIRVEGTNSERPGSREKKKIATRGNLGEAGRTPRKEKMMQGGKRSGDDGYPSKRVPHRSDDRS
jgi:hypothetical protein